MKDEHVKKRALKRIFKITNGSTPKSDVASYWDGDLVWVTPEDLGKLKGDTIATSRRGITQDGLANCGASLVPTDSIVLSTRAPIGSAAIAGVPLCTNQGCKSLVPRSPETVSRFFYYQIHSLKSELNVLGSGTTFLELSGDNLGQVQLFAPPPKRQRDVANFLDRETVAADALVAKYERLLELLEEKRITLITQAVTKGLNPNAPMKDSGVKWIGDIPASWRAVRLRFTCDITTGDRDTIHAAADGEYPFFVRSQQVERIADYGFDCEAVLTAGDGVGVGKVFHYYDGKFNAHQRVYVLSNFRLVEGMFFFYSLRANFARVTSQGTAKSTVDSIRKPTLQNFVMCVPPTNEQSKIIDYCDSVSRKYDGMIQIVQRAIDLAKERRSSLITAAVTGQIDVSTYKSGIGTEVA